MNQWCLLLTLLISLQGMAQGSKKISQLPLKPASGTGSTDSIPFYNISLNETDQVYLSDLINLPAMQAQFLSMIPSVSGQSGKVLSNNGRSTLWVTSTGVNTTLSNLTSPVAANEDFIFATGSNATLQTQDSASATAKNLIIRGGNVTGGFGDGASVLLKPGSSFGGSAGFVQFQPSGFTANPGYIIVQGTGSTGNMLWSSISSALDGGIGSNVGSLIYRSSGGWALLTPGSAGQILTINAGLPSWQSVPSGTQCGWYDTTATSLIYSCQGSDPNVSCPTGYTQRTLTNANAKVCSAN